MTTAYYDLPTNPRFFPYVKTAKQTPPETAVPPQNRRSGLLAGVHTQGQKADTLGTSFSSHEPQLDANAPAPSGAQLQKAKHHIAELLALIAYLGEEMNNNQMSMLQERLAHIKQHLAGLNEVMRSKADEALKQATKETEAGLWGKISGWLGKIFAAVGAAIGALAAFAHGNIAAGIVLIAVTVMAVWDLAAAIGKEIKGKDFMSLNAVMVQGLMNEGQTQEQAEKSAFIGMMVIVGVVAVAGVVCGFCGGASAASAAGNGASNAAKGAAKVSELATKIAMGYLRYGMAAMEAFGQAQQIAVSAVQHIATKELLDIQAALLSFKGDSKMQNDFFQATLELLQETFQFTQDMVDRCSEVIELQRPKLAF